MINRTKIFIGSLANIYGLLGITIVQIVSIPIFLNYWGSEKYGEWLILLYLPSFLVLFDLGLASVTTSEITKLITRKKYKFAKIVFINSFVTVAIIVLLILCLIYYLFFIAVLDLNYYLNIKTINNIRICLFFISLYYLLSIFIEFLEGLLRAYSFYPIASFITSTIRIVDGIIVSLIVIIQYNIEEISICIVIIKLLQIICIIYYIKHKIHFNISIYYLYLKPNYRLIKKGLIYLSLPLNNILNNQLMISLIGIFIGANTGAIINVIKLVLKFSTSLISIISSTIAFDINRLFNSKKIKDLKVFVAKAEIYAKIINFTYIIMFVIFYNNIIDLIFMNKNIDHIDQSIVYLFSFIVLTNNLYIIKINFHTAINIHDKILKKIIPLSIILNIINILLLMYIKSIILFLLLILIIEFINKKIIYNSYNNI